MPIPNKGLITETNRQYYEGAQGYQVDNVAGQSSFTTTFNTDLVSGGPNAWDSADDNYQLNNFKLYTSATGVIGTFLEYPAGLSGPFGFTVADNVITLTTPIPDNYQVIVQLKTVDGGNYGNEDAYGTAVEKNYGGYAYTTLEDVINGFMAVYVGHGKLAGAAKRTDVIFFAKRCLQEFSYDTLRSIKSQELTVPNSLSIALPQDYVNYVRISWIDGAGVKHLMYPTNNLTMSPGEIPLQDGRGIPIQDNFSNNVETESMTEERWRRNSGLASELENDSEFVYSNQINNQNTALGRRYGLETSLANRNGFFTMNDREGKISFSSDAVNKVIVLEYISDGLAYDMDSRVPKLAEEAMYASILHSILSVKSNQPEYVINRLKQEKSAKLRNAKLRLSNIKLGEFVQVLRGQSKFLKH
jgi:hypothetical protein